MKPLAKTTVAAMLASAALLIPFATGANAADNGAAQPAAGTGITLNAGEDQTLAGHKFTAYKLGDYTDVQPDAAGDKIASFGIQGTTETNRWAQDAIDTYNDSDTDKTNDVTIPIGYDAAAAIARIGNDQTKIRPIVKNLMNDANKPAAAVTDQTTNEASITLNVPDGYYIIIDSAPNSSPILLGTKIGGKDLTKQTLGVSYIKSQIVTLDKKLVKPDGTRVDSASLTEGSIADWEISFTLPNMDTVVPGNAVAGKLVDAPTGQQYVKGSVTATLKDGTVVTDLLDITEGGNNAAIPANPAIPNDKPTPVADNGFGIDLTRLMKAHPNKAVIIKAKTKIVDATNQTSLQKATGQFWFYDGKDITTPPPTVHENPVPSYKFDLHKTSHDDTTAKVKGAVFKIQNKTTGNWMKHEVDKETGKPLWTETGNTDADKTAATEFTTNDEGVATFTGLGAGTYHVEETKAPAGFSNQSIALPSFTVTITDNGEITFAGDKLPNLTVDQKNGNVQVQDITTLTQLPQTGGAWTVAFWISIGLIAGGTGFTVYATGRRLRKHAATA